VRTLLQSDAALKCHTLPSPFYSVHSFSISSPFPSPENIKITESVVQHNSRPIGLTLSTLNTLIISSVSSPDGASDRYAVNDLDLSCNCCVAKVCCKSARHWLTAAPGKSKQTTDESGVGHDGVGHDSCCVSARHCYLTLPTSSTTAGPVYHQRLVVFLGIWCIQLLCIHMNYCTSFIINNNNNNKYTAAGPLRRRYTWHHIQWYGTGRPNKM